MCACMCGQQKPRKDGRSRPGDNKATCQGLHQLSLELVKQMVSARPMGEKTTDTCTGLGESSTATAATRKEGE